jgi:hypothetical protein
LPFRSDTLTSHAPADDVSIVIHFDAKTQGNGGSATVVTGAQPVVATAQGAHLAEHLGQGDRLRARLINIDPENIADAAVADFSPNAQGGGFTAVLIGTSGLPLDIHSVTEGHATNFSQKLEVVIVSRDPTTGAEIEHVLVNPFPGANPTQFDLNLFAKVHP